MKRTSPDYEVLALARQLEEDLAALIETYELHPEYIKSDVLSVMSSLGWAYESILVMKMEGVTTTKIEDLCKKLSEYIEPYLPKEKDGSE